MTVVLVLVVWVRGYLGEGVLATWYLVLGYFMYE